MSADRTLTRPVLVDQIADALRRDILHGTLRPGQRITVSTLAKELGVSHIPVREAVRRLEAEALIETVPHQGALVADVHLDELHEIYELRRLIEGDIAARAATAYRPEDLDTIDAALRRLLDADPTDPAGNWMDAHRAFHAAILAPASTVWNQRLLGLLWQSAERYHRLYTLVFGSLSSANADHAGLAVAARRGVPVEMQDLLVQHLHHTEEAVTTGYLATVRAEDGDPGS